MPKVTLTLSTEEFENMIAGSPELKKLYDSLVLGTVEMSGEDEKQVSAIVANLMLSSLMGIET